MLFRHFGNLVRSLSRAGRVLPESERPLFEQKVVWAVQAISARFRIVDNCLVKALVTRILFGRAGIPVDIKIGIAKGTKAPLEAHAWVESHGKIILGESQTPFVPFPGLQNVFS